MKKIKKLNDKLLETIAKTSERNFRNICHDKKEK